MTTALVLGGSVGGLLAARALSDHFDEVTLVERDRFPEIGEQRKGVPQGRHVHGLLCAGGEVMEEFFPGLRGELVAGGAVDVDLANDFGWIHEGHPHLRYASGLRGLMSTRPYLEGHLRRRTLALPKIRGLDGHDIDELVWQGDRVVGARVTRREDQATETLTADLVVDATGRGSRLPGWLAAHGFEAPVTEEVRIGITYVTRWFRRRPGDNRSCVVTPRPPGTGFGIVLATEGDRYMSTIGSYLDEEAPTDLPGFIDFAGKLAAPHVRDVLVDLEPIGDGEVFRFPASTRRRYEALARFPEGLLVLGDAICSFNPVFGQGMTVAALEARLLRELLGGRRAELGRRFLRAAAKLVDNPWDIAVGSDLRYPKVNGKRTPFVRFLHWYLSRLHIVAEKNRNVAFAFQRVGNLLAPPPHLLSPGVLFRVLAG